MLQVVAKYDTSSYISYARFFNSGGGGGACKIITQRRKTKIVGIW